MTAMTFDSTEPAYTSASTAVDSGNGVFGNTAVFERLQGRRKTASKMPYILAGALVVAGLGAYGVSELLSRDTAEPAVAAAPSAQVLPVVVTPPAQVVSAETPAPVAATAAMSPAPAASAPAPAVRVAQRPAARPAVRPAAGTASAESAPAVSAAAAPTVMAPPPVLSVPAPAPAEAASAPINSPPPINPDPGAAIQ